jgi:hypothetical protein
MVSCTGHRSTEHRFVLTRSAEPTRVVRGETTRRAAHALISIRILSHRNQEDATSHLLGQARRSGVKAVVDGNDVRKVRVRQDAGADDLYQREELAAGEVLRGRRCHMRSAQCAGPGG